MKQLHQFWKVGKVKRETLQICLLIKKIKVIDSRQIEDAYVIYYWPMHLNYFAPNQKIDEAKLYMEY